MKYYTTYSDEELMHYGVLGMKWGVRRYQRKDGSLTKKGKKHKEAALKGLREGQKAYAQRADAMKAYTSLNAKSLKEVSKKDPEDFQASWARQSLRDAYKATGREYLNSKLRAEAYTKYIDAYNTDTIKVGEDYVVKNLKTGRVKLTDGGIQKETEILTRVTDDFKKRHAKEIKKYT